MLPRNIFETTDASRWFLCRLGTIINISSFDCYLSAPFSPIIAHWSISMQENRSAAQQSSYDESTETVFNQFRCLFPPMWTILHLFYTLINLFPPSFPFSWSRLWNIMHQKICWYNSMKFAAFDAYAGIILIRQTSFYKLFCSCASNQSLQSKKSMSVCFSSRIMFHPITKCECVCSQNGHRQFV